MGEMRMELANVEECERYKSAENNFVVVWSKRGKKRAVGRALTPTYRPLKYPGQRFVDRNEFYPIGKWTFFTPLAKGRLRSRTFLDADGTAAPTGLARGSTVSLAEHLPTGGATGN